MYDWNGPLPIKTPEKELLFQYIRQRIDVDELISYVDVKGDEYNIFGSAKRAPSKIIWMYWHQGWSTAPPIAQLCRDSWIKFNPDCELISLDKYSLNEYLPGFESISESGIGIAGLSDRVRLNLLSKYGGIWADATLFCSMPAYSLCALLTQLSSFFVFPYPAPDRLISTWFMVAAKNSSLATAWSLLIDRYLQSLSENRIHHYFFAHYLYEYLIVNTRLSSIHASMPHLCVNYSVRLSSIMRLDDAYNLDTLATKKQLDAVLRSLGISPVHKLTWKGAVRLGSRRSLQLLDILTSHIASTSDGR